MIESLQSIVHPYPRYGLAVALYRKCPDLNQLDEPTLALLLVDAIETGLGHFRMATPDMPSNSEVLHYEPLTLDALRENNRLVQSSGLATQGIYLCPSVLTTDGDAKGTFDNAQDIIKNLRDGKALDSVSVFSRSFAPTTAKINNGKRSLSEPRGTLLEAACSVITTVTPTKPAAWIGGRNTGIIPDLPLEQLYDFIELFERMMTSGLEGDLMQARLAPKTPASLQPAKRVPKKTEGGSPKSEYRRPRLHNGNYPFAPQRDAAAFGAVGLLGAIGRWAIEAKETPWADKADGVLNSIANKPLYIISYDYITQSQMSHHVVRLAQSGELSEMIRTLTYDTRLGPEIDADKPIWDSKNRQLFHLMTSRFLGLFNAASFRDFVAYRTEYPSSLKPLFQEYFMQTHEITDELKRIVQAAEAYGRWLNDTAYRTAKSEAGKEPDKGSKDYQPYWEKVRKEKAKIVTVLESAAMSARSSGAMLSQVSTQAGRLGQGDAPDAAEPFVYAVMTGRIDFEDARQLLMVYLRLQSPKERNANPLTPSNEPEPQVAEDQDGYSLTSGDNDGN